MSANLGRRAAAETIGSAFLLAAVVGSGIMAERLSAGNMALALLANAIATGGTLVALIHTFAPISGAHFNPVVTLGSAMMGETRWWHAGTYFVAQLVGAVAGVWLAHLMFDLPILEASRHVRAGSGQWAGEFVATFGLLTVIESGKRHFPAALPGAIAAYITGAYWFTSSTSFANPAVTIARSLTDSFAGIAPSSVPGFIVAQLLATVAALIMLHWLHRQNHVRPNV